MTAERERDIEVSVTSRGRPSAAAIADGVQELLEVADGEAGAVLGEAVGNETEWGTAFSNPVAYLEARAIALPEGVQLSLHQQPTATPTWLPSPSAPMLEPRPLDHERMRAYCESIGGQLVEQITDVEVCRRWIEFCRWVEQPDGTWICVLVTVCQERGFDRIRTWVCSSP